MEWNPESKTVLDYLAREKGSLSSYWVTGCEQEKAKLKGKSVPRHHFIYRLVSQSLEVQFVPMVLSLLSFFLLVSRRKAGPLGSSFKLRSISRLFTVPYF